MPYSTAIPQTAPVAHQASRAVINRAPAIQAGQPFASADIMNAVAEEGMVSYLAEHNRAQPAEVAAAKVRRHTVEAEQAAAAYPGAAGAPAWFVQWAHDHQQQLHQEFAGIRTEMANIRTEMATEMASIRTEMATEMANIRTELGQLKAMTTRSWNAAAGEGTVLPWWVVPFVNGQDPTAAPHNLPAITSWPDVRGMQAAQLTAYIQGYNLQAPARVAERRKVLAHYLGFKVPL